MYIPLPTKPVRRYIESIASSAIRCVYVYIYIYQKVRKLAYMYRRYIKVPVRIYINTYTYWPSRHISVNASAWRIFHNFYIYYKYVYRSEFRRKFHWGQLVCVILWWFMHQHGRYGMTPYLGPFLQWTPSCTKRCYLHSYVS